MRITIIDPILDKRWDDFIRGHPESTIFHHSAWAHVLQERYNRSPTYYVLEGEHGEILAAAPFFRIQSLLMGKRLACLPCCAYCFPLAYTPEHLSQLLTVAKEEVDSGQVSYLEIRGWTGSIAPEELGLKEHLYWLTHVASLDNDPERLRAKLDHDAHYHLKRNLKQAERSGLTVREAQSEDDLRAFHRLTITTRRRLNLLPWPYDFFQSIRRHIILPGHGFLLLAELQDKVIGGCMYFCFKDTVILKFNAWDKTYSHYRPNYLITWKAMERACQEGYKRLDFGISNPENTGLVAFKKQWLSAETIAPYYYYPAIRGASSLSQSCFPYQAYTTLNRLMPGLVLKLAGRALYRHMG